MRNSNVSPEDAVLEGFKKVGMAPMSHRTPEQRSKDFDSDMTPMAARR